MRIARAVADMTLFYGASRHDVEHFLKVWAYARTLGYQADLDAAAQETLELAAIVHDIACPRCRALYGSAQEPDQEREGAAMAWDFFADYGLPEAQLQRICYLVGHHHTFTQVEGLDYQLLLEADFLVNAGESGREKEAICAVRDQVFRSQGGTALLNSIYGLQ